MKYSKFSRQELLINMATNEGLARLLSSAIERAVSDVLDSRGNGQNVQATNEAAYSNSSLQNVPRNVTNTSDQTSDSVQSISRENVRNQASLSINRTRPRHQPTLPSAFGQCVQVTPTPKRKQSRSCQPKPGKTYTKDIVCIPPKMTKNLDTYPIPKGESRANLAKMGLIGKIYLESTWSAEEVENEISSVFSPAFNLPDNLPFEYTYLSTMPGTKKLSVPRISSSFRWNAPEVLSLCSQGAIYIASKENPAQEYNCLENNESGDSDSELLRSPFDDVGETSASNNSVTTSHEFVNSCASSHESHDSTINHHRSYIEIIDDEMIISSDEESADVQIAIRNSLVRDEDSVPLQSILQEHIKKEMIGMPSNADAPKNIINVRRKYAFKDGVEKMRRARFIASHPLSVKFADGSGQSEGAVDRGGPTREFLRIAIHQMFDSKMFGGKTKNKVFILDQESKQDESYKLCGKLLAVSLCNGGGVGRCFSKSVYKFVVECEKAANPDINDVCDVELRTLLEKVNVCQSEDQFKLLEPDLLNHLTEAGWSTTISFNKKDMIISTLCQYSVIDKVRSCLEQFKDGLQTLHILDLVTKHPAAFEDVFCYNEGDDLTSKILDDLFYPCLSETGTIKREKEEQIIMHWRDYLADSEAGGRGQATLKDLLIFTTGSDEIPPVGFDPVATIEFWEDTKPMANTCSNVLHLPLHPNSQDVNYEHFKEMMNFGILNSPCFGNA